MIDVAMRMPYQRMTIGPSWNAIAPGELITRGSTPRRITRGGAEIGIADHAKDASGWSFHERPMMASSRATSDRRAMEIAILLGFV